MPLERLEFFSILEADDVLRRDRFLDRDRGFRRLGGRMAVPGQHSGQGGVHLVDQRRQIRGRDRIVADVGRNDGSRQLDECRA